ncbi:MAG: S8 family serine peptidase, partial [Anaerolineales bacterium]|nr:S8 family serine peptidase [Anaerolineales bacterium]
NNPDMTITFSAGNAGVDGDSDGFVDLDSMGSPATAKNVITVGASENDRDGNWDCDASLSYTDCAAQGGQNIIFTYGTAWGSDYPANPIAGDPSAGNAEQLAAFSSRGPADDGRIKPDVVAPGTWVLSGYVSLHQEEYDSSPDPLTGAYQYDGWGFPYNEHYKYMGGTSMSNPLTAGAAAVVRQYYADAHSLNASAALVKATLINSAKDLLDENNDGVNDNDFPIPNNHEGWGLVNLAAATDGSHQFVENTTGISTGGSASYPYNISSGAFKVSLVWSDYPSTETAAANLVNNLNLRVTAPGGQVYLGNVFSGGWSATGGSTDSVNNVENVYIQSAAAGTWTVEVIGSSIPQGPQPFALVVDSVSGEPVDTPPTVSITSPANGATVAGMVSVTADASDDDAVTQVEFVVDGTSYVDTDGSDGWSISWDTTANNDGSYIISATATDTASQTGSDSISVTV